MKEMGVGLGVLFSLFCNHCIDIHLMATLLGTTACYLQYQIQWQQELILPEKVNGPTKVQTRHQF